MDDSAPRRHAAAYDRQYAALGALSRAPRDSWDRDVASFTQANGDWLERDARLDTMPPEQYRFVQWLAQRQHDELRSSSGGWG